MHAFSILGERGNLSAALNTLSHSRELGINIGADAMQYLVLLEKDFKEPNDPGKGIFSQIKELFKK